uniref:C-type lectin domain-containing protein n=1 Tax=Panagrellus redivivus TaxID=6233 RepID=A0A7E4VUN8_PANRE
MELSTMLLLFAVFVFTFHQRFTSADSNLPENKYPGLTLAEARCPESAKDGYYWYIIPGFNNSFGCFGRTNLLANINSFKKVEYACRKMHKDAVPARFRTDYNLAHYRFLTENAIIGASFLGNDNGAKISSGVSAIYLNNGQVETVNLATISADPRDKYIMCMTPPYPRFMHRYYNKPITIQQNLSEYTCEGTGWDLHPSCDGTPFCYKQIKTPTFPTEFQNMLAEFNVCGMEEPNSFMASVHCQEEYDYMNANYANSNAVQLGLHVPNRGPWNKADSWQNTDGTPADFVPWQLWEPNNADDERSVFIRYGRGFYDFNGKNGNVKHVLCKKAAVKIELFQDVKHYDVFKVEGKRCRFERATHWNRQCPTNSNLWQIVPSDKGVHCYALVKAPVPLSNNNFNHEICHGLHPRAKLASIHYDRQLGFLYPLTNHTRVNNVIIGLLRNNQSFKWSDDGTPVKRGFWAPSLC